MSEEYIVKPVYKALNVLRCLGEEPQPLSLADICFRVRLPKTTVFRYLYTLRECGFVEHDAETDRYRLGLEALELGRTGSAPLQIRTLALPWMYKLRDQFNETVNLGVLDGHDVVYIELVESRHPLRMQSALGSRDPVYSTALGKAILAFTPHHQWNKHLPERFTALTAHTLTSRRALARALADVQKCGYAIDNQENDEGARCIGVPIFDGRGRVPVALSVSGPIARLDEQRTTEIAQALLDVSDRLSQRLGYREGRRQE